MFYLCSTYILLMFYFSQLLPEPIIAYVRSMLYRFVSSGGPLKGKIPRSKKDICVDKLATNV